jgi:D-lactate dehydrogenase (cytochrome)
MERLGVWSGTMFTAIGSSGFLYEIALYWPDCRTVYHEREIDPAYLASLPRYDANPEARAYVAQLKSDLIELYVEHGASFFQIGRAYPFTGRLNPPALALLASIKQLLDEQSAMNPGVLGLG